MIYLRTVTDDSGDTVDLLWYHSQTCYSDSFASLPATEPNADGRVIGGVESGGAYPCGEESDTLDFCAHCGCVVGNPLTDDGTAELPDIVTDLIARGDSPSLTRANEIVSEYSYAVPPNLQRILTRATMRAYHERGYE